MTKVRYSIEAAARAAGATTFTRPPRRTLAQALAEAANVTPQAQRLAEHSRRCGLDYAPGPNGGSLYEKRP